MLQHPIQAPLQAPSCKAKTYAPKTYSAESN